MSASSAGPSDKGCIDKLLNALRQRKQLASSKLLARSLHLALAFAHRAVADHLPCAYLIEIAYSPGFPRQQGDLHITVAPAAQSPARSSQAPHDRLNIWRGRRG
jgi:hypothetical protein